MDVKALKEYLYNNNYVEQLLNNIGCHHIKYHTSKEYWSCANKDGDNVTAINVFNNENLGCVNYTRSMIDVDRGTDIIDLICYTLDISFPECLKYICNEIGINYYHDFSEEEPNSFYYLELLKSMDSGEFLNDEKEQLKPISENILNYYRKDVNDLFMNDNIDYDTQIEFEVGYDPETNRITIPIRSMIGDLVGVKGRLFKKELLNDELKYIYLEPCARSQVIYGLNKTYDFIQQNRCIFICEAEKAVMQLWSYGYKNSGAVGGKKISRQQIELLIRLGVDLVFCFDKDVQDSELKELRNKFPENMRIFYMTDKDNILKEKESPSDDPIKWDHMVKNNIYKM